MNDTTSARERDTLTRDELSALLDGFAALGRADDALLRARRYFRDADYAALEGRVSALMDEVLAIRKTVTETIASRV